MRDHVHICISIPPKYSVSYVGGYLKEKCAIAIARHFKGRQQNVSGEHFWARGCFVSTVGPDKRGFDFSYGSSMKFVPGHGVHTLDMTNSLSIE